MAKDLTALHEKGATWEEVLAYAMLEYDFSSSMSAIRTMLLRYAKGWYEIVDPATGKIRSKNRNPKEVDSLYGGLTRDCADMLRKARSAALDAVSIYNTPSLNENSFRSANYIVLMMIAWTALFHAIFFKKGVEPYHDDESSDGPDSRVGHMWALRMCLATYFENPYPPTYENLRFLAELRERIEHRFLPTLDDQIFGECQACLLNFETMLTERFGDAMALNARLAFALQFSRTLHGGQIEAIRESQMHRTADILEFVESFRGKLPDVVATSAEFAFRVHLVPNVGTRVSSSDAAVEFVHFDPENPGDMDKYSKVSTLIKERQVPVANFGKLRVRRGVVPGVAERLPWRFTENNHTSCWQHYGVRPAKDDSHPERTQERYCQWDSVHGDYVYTKQWVEFLVKKLSEPGEFAKATGKAPLPKEAGSET